MYGDRPGSPRRDERQSFAPQEPWQAADSAPAAHDPAHGAAPYPGGVHDAFAPAPQPPAFEAPAYEASAYEAPAYEASAYEASVPETPAPAATAPQPAVAHSDDVKVAGAARTRSAPPAGDTLGFQSLPDGPGGPAAPTGGSRDEIASGEGPGPRRSAPRVGAGRRNGMRIVAVAAGAAVVIGGGAAAAFALTGGSGGDDGATVQPTRPLADAEPKVDPRVLEEQRRKLALERASRESRQYSGKELDLRPKGEPLPTKTPEKKPTTGTGGGNGGGGAPVSDPVPAGEAQQIAKKMMPSFGFTGDGEFGCLVKLWNKESGWRTNAANPSSQAYGIPQANPGSKMATAGADWRTSASTQIKWGLGYIKGRYGTPCSAWSHSQRVGWY